LSVLLNAGTVIQYVAQQVTLWVDICMQWNCISSSAENHFDISDYMRSFVQNDSQIYMSQIYMNIYFIELCLYSKDLWFSPFITCHSCHFIVKWQFSFAGILCYFCLNCILV